MNEPRSKPELTKRQQDIYEFVKEKIVNRGYGPTIREIGLKFDIRSPNGVMCHLKALEKKGLITREPNMSRAIQLTEPPVKRTSLLLAGQVAAGSPVLAVQQDERVDFGDLFGEEDHFCLQVKGESMIDDSISDGDFVIIHRQSTAKNGDIVVAIVDGAETTLKRYYKESSRIRLESANKKVQPMYSSNVQVMGKVQGVIRRYRP
ncbi:MAG: transcriptional repressor LexA [Planctomycetota bacterium]|nr:transcriptional repressor LexA [Planctomycetota bacterium]MDA1214178.1 transcriptional repressor LexA [Planctomycetota bacterium]